MYMTFLQLNLFLIYKFEISHVFDRIVALFI